MKKSLGLVLSVTLLLIGCSRGESVSFRTQDGFELSARVWGDAATAIVFVHHSEQPVEREGLLSPGMWDGFDEDLAKEHRVADVDLRGQGKSEGTTDPLRISRDISAAVNMVQRLGSRKVVVIGSQIAGAAAIQAAASGDIAGLVTLSTTDEGGLDPVADVAQAQAMFFFAASAGDESSSQYAKDLLRASLAPDSGFHLSSGKGDGAELLRGRSGDRLKADILAWIAKVFE